MTAEMHEPGSPPRPARRIRLRTVVFRAFASLTAVALLALSVASGTYFHRHHEELNAAQLDDAAAAMAHRLRTLIEGSRRELVLAAHSFDDSGERRPAELERALAHLQGNQSAWRTLIVTDRHGRVVAGAPSVRGGADTAKDDALSVADRAYFLRARDTGAPYVSNVFLGRGFGRDPIVAISVPLRTAGGAFDGVLEGSLDLGRLAGPGRPDPGSETGSPVVLDAAGAVVYAGDAGRFPTLAQAPGLRPPAAGLPAHAAIVDAILPAVGALPAMEAECRWERVRLAGAEGDWWVAIVRDRAVTRRHFREQLGWLALALVATLAGVAVTARHVAARITRPVERIVAHARHAAAQSPASGTAAPHELPIRELDDLQRDLTALDRGRGKAMDELRASLAEKERLAAEVIASREALRRSHQTLEERVAERTAQLEAVVAQLESEIEQRKYGERVLEVENAVLGQVVLRRPLAETLATIVAGVEREAGDSIASIMRLDDDNPRLLRVGASRQLPEDYVRLIDGIPVGPEIGTCGRAAHLVETVVTEDIAVDPNWAAFAPAALRSGLRSCWSMPIRGAGGELLGTFAIYHRTPSRPTAREQRVLQQATNTAAVAIAVHRAELARHRLEEQLRKAQKLEAVGTLASGIAHGFNNLLVPILGYADLLRTSPLAANPEVQRQIEQIIGASRQARALIQELLAFSRNAPPARCTVAPAAILREVADMLRAVAPAGVSVVVEAEDAGCRISADPAQLHHLLMNLGNNAVQALDPQGGTVRLGLRRLADADAPAGVSLRGKGPHVCLSVSDNGPGMTAEVRARVFEPFFSTKPVGRGTGLGLAVAHGIVEVHGGAIAVESAPGNGCTIRIYLPADPADAGPPVSGVAPEPVPVAELPPPAPPVRGRPLDVLLVDDEPSVSAVFSLVLGRAGHRVTAEPRGADALARLTSADHRCDVLISDVTMPGMTGLELASRVKKLRPALPVLLLTGYGVIDPAVLAEIGEPCRVLAKPVEAATLLAAVAALTAEKRPA